MAVGMARRPRSTPSRNVFIALLSFGCKLEQHNAFRRPEDESVK
jgi:hypothetical protein